MNQQPPIARPRLDRQRIIRLLGALSEQLATADEPTTIRVVGGAALALRIPGARSVTSDIDAIPDPADLVERAVEFVSLEYGAPNSRWFSSDAKQYLPNGYGRPLEWTTIHLSGAVTIQMPSFEMLLAMKLDAAQRRGARDGIDIAPLLSVTGLDIPRAESVYEAFYPGDELTARTYAILTDAAKRASQSEVREVSVEEIAREIRAAEDFMPVLRQRRREHPDLFRDSEEPPENPSPRDRER